MQRKRKTIERKRLEISKKIRYQGNISCKDGHDNRNDKDLREAEEIKKR